MGKTGIAFALALLAGVSLAAQQPPANPLTNSIKADYTSIKNYVTKSAEQVAEKDYSFKATPAVRTFGELIGHLANENFAICGAVTGDKAPAADYEKTTAKADLQKALADSLAVCDKAFAAVNDQNAAQAVTLFGRPNTKLGALSLNSGHLNEHYGNIVTYMRLKGMVPPSSAGGGGH